MKNLYKLQDIIFPTRREAEDVLIKLLGHLYTYKVVSVADLYDLIGVTSKIMDSNYGWTDLTRAMTCSTIGGYKLELPTPELFTQACPDSKAKMKPEPIILTIPNIDTCISEYIICPKEVMQKAYVEKIGKCIDFCGKSRVVKSVEITEDFIFVKLV